MKSYTDLEQSKKLAEILSLETADGFWEYHNKWHSEGDEWEGYEDYPRAEPYLEYTRKEDEWKEDKSDVPCWSLAALLNAIDFNTINLHYYNARTDWVVSATIHDSTKHCTKYESTRTPNHIDACYELILKLHESKLL